MASFTSSSSFFFLFSLSAMLATCSAIDPQEENTTHLHFYFHEVYEGAPDPTSFVVVPSISKKPSTFGEIRVFDNALREGVEPSSKLVGRAQGMVIQESLGIQAILSTINFVFTEGTYNGSSLALLGRADGSMVVNDRGIVGGTEKFHLAKGYALSKVVNYTTLSVVVEFDVYVML